MMVGTKNHILAFAAILATLIALANIFFGYAPSDDGFILAYSWRIWNGEIPHKDFLYVRPALSPLFHTIWFTLPENWSFLAARAFFYFQILLPGALLWHWARSKKWVKADFVYYWTFVAFAIFAIHNFPPMPWHTVDGVFFASLALYCFLRFLDFESRHAWIWGSIAATCALLSAFTKQNFAAVPLLLGLASAGLSFYLIRAKQIGRALTSLLAFLIPTILLSSAAWMLLRHYEALDPMREQITGSSKVSDLLDAGIWTYLKRLPVKVAAIAFLWWAFLGSGAKRPWVQNLAISLVAGGAVFIAWKDLTFWGSLLFLATTVVIVSERTVFLRNGLWAAYALGVLAIAWVSSISWGYTTPLLGILPLGVIWVWVWQRKQTSIHHGTIAAASMTSVLVMSWLWIEMPYQQPSRMEMSEALHAIVPKVGVLYVTPKNLEIHEDLKLQLSKLSEQARGRAFVTPKMPLTYYFFGIKNPTPLDWYNPNEERNHIDWLWQRVSSQAMHMFALKVDPEKGCEPSNVNPRTSSVTQRVLETWMMVDESKWFCQFSRGQSS